MPPDVTAALVRSRYLTAPARSRNDVDAAHGGAGLADEVGAIRFLIESSASGPFNLTAPEPVTNRVFSRTLASVLRRPGFMPAPAPALRLLLGEMADLILTGQRAVPARLLDLGYAFRFADLEDALRDIYGG